MSTALNIEYTSMFPLGSRAYLLASPTHMLEERVLALTFGYFQRPIIEWASMHGATKSFMTASDGVQMSR